MSLPAEDVKQYIEDRSLLNAIITRYLKFEPIPGQNSHQLCFQNYNKNQSAARWLSYDFFHSKDYVYPILSEKNNLLDLIDYLKNVISFTFDIWLLKLKIAVISENRCHTPPDCEAMYKNQIKSAPDILTFLLSIIQALDCFKKNSTNPEACKEAIETLRVYYKTTILPHSKETFPTRIAFERLFKLLSAPQVGITDTDVILATPVGAGAPTQVAAVSVNAAAASMEPIVAVVPAVNESGVFLRYKKCDETLRSIIEANKTYNQFAKAGAVPGGVFPLLLGYRHLDYRHPGPKIAGAGAGAGAGLICHPNL